MAVNHLYDFCQPYVALTRQIVFHRFLATKTGKKKTGAEKSFSSCL
jgi:hypothetical protein